MLAFARFSTQFSTDQRTVACGCGKSARVDSQAFKRDLSDIVRLMAKCPHYGKWPLKSIERVILPAVDLHQYKVFRYAKQPVGFVTWAFLSDEAHQAFIDHSRLLQPSDFNSGDRLWVMDVCTSADAPKGLPRKMIRYLRERFADRAYQGGAFWKKGNKSHRGVRSAYV
jgi:cytolysin-activating lysine-acyltransferase